MNKLPIIAFAPHPWHEDAWMNRQQLLSRLGKRGWPTVYSYGALNIWQRHSDQWKQASLIGKTIESDYVKIYLPGKLIPRWDKYPIYDQLVITSHLNHLKKTLNINLSTTQHITILFHPSYWPYAKALNSDYLVFHIYDTFSKSFGWNGQIKEIYYETLKRADLITASSEAMVEDLPGNLLKKVKILHNGVDTESFNPDLPLTCPADLKDIPHPRIINTGTINRKIDLSLIAEIAEKKPTWHWILIGLIHLKELENNSSFSIAFKKCQQLDNIHFLGEKPRTQVSSYVKHSDIMTMIYRIKEGEWFFDGYPLKVNEYLAMGKPTISSPIKAIKAHFSHIVDISTTSSEWIQAIDNALTNGGVGTPEERKSLAKKNSWDNRVDMLENWIQEIIQ